MYPCMCNSYFIINNTAEKFNLFIGLCFSLVILECDILSFSCLNCFKMGVVNLYLRLISNLFV